MSWKPCLGAALVVWLVSGCSSVFYQPSKSKFFELDPARVKFEDVFFQSSDGTKLHGWYFPAIGGKPKGMIVQFHGNAENLTSHFYSYVWVIEQGYDFFTFDYRGYGQSEGKPDQKGLYQDALSAIEWASKKTTAPLVLVGQSLGGAVLMRAFPDSPERARAKAVVVESTFYSYQAIASDLLSRSWMTWLFQWLGKAWISDQYSPEETIEKISPTPFLVIHGTADKVIPHAFGEEIYRRARDPKDLWIVPGGGHIQTMAVPKLAKEYHPRLLAWLESIKK